MMYPFMTLDDGTEIVHSETLPQGQVKVYIERPDAKTCFHSAACYLPEYRWEEIVGFSDNDISRFCEILESTAHLILAFAREGGFEHASNF